MKLVDDIVKKIGVSNLLHVLVSALIVTCGGLFPFPGIMVGIIIAVILGIGKEKLDTKFDINDIKYDLIGIGGGLCVWLISSIFN